MTDIPTPALSEFKLYRRVGEIEARPWTAEDEYRFVRGDTGRISISPADRETGKVHGLHGGYIARNPANHADQWYIAPDYFAKQYAESTHSPALREAAKERAEVIRECWEAIDKYIKPGPLQGNGCDETAQRNGMILASNLLMEMLAALGGEK